VLVQAPWPWALLKMKMDERMEICDAGDLNNPAYEHLLRSTRALIMVKHTFEAPTQKARLNMRSVATGGALVKETKDRYVKESLDPGRHIIEATAPEFVEMGQKYRLTQMSPRRLR